MIEARRALFSHLRLFVERELTGMFSWDDAREGATFPSEMIGARRNPLGPVKEIVEIRLGGYVVRVHSSQEHGPCGLVQAEFPDDTAVDIGPLDQSSFQRLGEMIREHKTARA